MALMDSVVPSMPPTPSPTNATVATSNSDCATEDNAPFDRTSWIIAVTLAIFAAFINNLGLNLQKLAWTKKQSGIISKHVYLTYWATGMILVVLASIFDFVALAFGPQSVIAPLGALTMVSNAIVAPWMHGEKLHQRVLIATLIIVVGCAISVGAASHTNNICDIDSLFALYLTGRFAAYALILFSMIGFLLWYIKRAENLLSQFGADSTEYLKVFRYHRISYAGLSGVFGSQSVLFARSVSQMFVGSARGGRIFLAYPGTYLVVAALVGCIVLQIYWLNQGLARFESLYNVPIFTSTWIVGTALGGGIFYGEFSTFSLAQAILFPLGVFLCIFGVSYLSGGTSEDHVISPEGLTVEEGMDGFQASTSDAEAITDDESKTPPHVKTKHNSKTTRPIPASNVSKAATNFFEDEDDHDQKAASEEDEEEEATTTTTPKPKSGKGSNGNGNSNSTLGSSKKDDLSLV